jgi:UDP:flavonoid glycosyltransferase YjiC (YdhE family)
MAQLVLQALEKTNQRGILVSGWGGLEAKDLPPSVFMATSIPFDWLFPQVAVAVHHGGAGTTAAALRAGIPSVVIPFGLDQPFWGRQVRRLGVGPAPIPPKRLTANRLAKAIQTALQDQSMRRCASDIGERVRSEDGVQNAADIIGTVLGTS